jgi:hypothetical protein
MTADGDATGAGAGNGRCYCPVMGRIADAALAHLAGGPATAEDLAGALARAGATRAKDPVRAVRGALRDDHRFVLLSDGRLASGAQLLADVVLTARVTESAHLRGALDTDGDLAPFAAVGATRAVLPVEVRPGDCVLVRVADPETGRLEAVRAPNQLQGREDEAELVGVARRMVAVDGGGGVKLAAVLCDVAASSPDAYRRPSRPLSEVLGEVGLDVHLGWVAPVGTRWGVTTEREILELEAGVADQLAADRPAEAVELQERLVELLRRHYPERVPEARRRLARVFARAGRVGDGLGVLTGAFGFDDPEDRYEASLLAIRLGDVVSARRWAEEGLARVAEPTDAEVGEALEDLAGDLDAHATYRAVLEWLPAPETRIADAPELAGRLVSPRRSYLVGALIEQCFAPLHDPEAIALVRGLDALGMPGRDALLACGAVLDGPAGAAARQLSGTARHARRPWVEGLLAAHPVDAWLTVPASDSAQQHMIMAIAKESGRWAPLVVVITGTDSERTVEDAFFLNDLAELRFRRELLRPITELGLPLQQVPVAEATDILADGLARAGASGHRLDALDYQPVTTRIEHLVMAPMARRRGGSGDRHRSAPTGQDRGQG